LVAGNDISTPIETIELAAQSADYPPRGCLARRVSRDHNARLFFRVRSVPIAQSIGQCPFA